MIYQLRHGETVWNTVGRFQGRKDSPLTTHGIEQADQMGKLLSREIAGREEQFTNAGPLGLVAAQLQPGFRLSLGKAEPVPSKAGPTLFHCGHMIFAVIGHKLIVDLFLKCIGANLSDLDVVFDDRDCAFLEDQQPTSPRTGSDHRLTGLKRRNWKGGKPFCKYRAVGDYGYGTFLNAIGAPIEYPAHFAELTIKQTRRPIGQFTHSGVVPWPLGTRINPD